MANILIIDDDLAYCRTLSWKLNSLGHISSCAHTIREGLWLASEKQPDLVFLDVHMPDGNGIDAVHAIRNTKNSPETVIITGSCDRKSAQTAVEVGAWDYVQKGISLGCIVQTLDNALLYRKEKSRVPKQKTLLREKIIGSSPQLLQCLNLVAQAAKSSANVLLTGETGTGKELFAQALHDNSEHPSERFVVVDCAALPDALVESILFGHEKGAFTGAVKDRCGLISQAHGGTLFLDEVGELSLPMQKAFLRVLQEKRFRPVGGAHEIRSNFKLISATNKNLDEMARQGGFRKDLLFRLRSLVIALPPLRERIGDICEIAEYHLEKICERDKIKAKTFSSDFVECLKKYPWTGNVRELVQMLERAVASADGCPILFPIHLPNEIRAVAVKSLIPAPLPAPRASPKLDLSKQLPSLKQVRDAAVADYLGRLMSATGGDLSQIRKILGVSRPHLYDLFKKHKISLS